MQIVTKKLNNILSNLRRYFFDLTHDHAGYSLIEIILVIIFLGIALVATMDLMSSGMVNRVENEILTTAVNLANEKLEEIYGDKNNKGYDYINESNYPDEVSPDGFVGYNRYVIITDQTTYKEVEVRVTHPNIEDCSLIVYLTNY
jgi:type II secretory pathway pseudopilin PulG